MSVQHLAPRDASRMTLKMRERELANKRAAWALFVPARSPYLKQDVEWYQSDAACAIILPYLCGKKKPHARRRQRAGGEEEEQSDAKAYSMSDLRAFINEQRMDCDDEELEGGGVRIIDIVSKNVDIKRRALSLVVSPSSPFLRKDDAWYNSPQYARVAINRLVGGGKACKIRYATPTPTDRDGFNAKTRELNRLINVDIRYLNNMFKDKPFDIAVEFRERNDQLLILMRHINEVENAFGEWFKAYGVKHDSLSALNSFYTIFNPPFLISMFYKHIFTQEHVDYLRQKYRKSYDYYTAWLKNNLKPCGAGIFEQKKLNTCWFNAILNGVVYSEDAQRVFLGVIESFLAELTNKKDFLTLQRIQTDYIEDACISRNPHDINEWRILVFTILYRRIQSHVTVEYPEGILKFATDKDAMPPEWAWKNNAHYQNFWTEMKVYCLFEPRIQVCTCTFNTNDTFKDREDGTLSYYVQNELFTLPISKNVTRIRVENPPPLFNSVDMIVRYIGFDNVLSNIKSGNYQDAIYTEQLPNIPQQPNCPNMLIGNITYRLDHAIITFAYKYVSGKNQLHTVAGVYCNSKPYICDSSFGVIEYKWDEMLAFTKFDTVQMLGQSYIGLKALVSMPGVRTCENIFISSVVYIKNNNPDRNLSREY